MGQCKKITLELIDPSDRELWILNNVAGEMEWELPMFLEWRRDKGTNEQYALIVPAVSPYPTQAMAIRSRLSPFSVTEDSNRWIIAGQHIPHLLRKAPGITPRRYYRWPDEAMPLIPAAMPVSVEDGSPEALECDEFLQHVSKRSEIPLAVLRVVWQAICSDAGKWMLKNNKSLDFGFVKLLALPFRANWKEIVAAKLGRSGLASILGMSRKARRQQLQEIDLPATLCSLDNVAISDNCMQYVIEAVPTPRFTADCNRAEGRKMAAGVESYVRSFEDAVESQYDDIIEVLKENSRKVGMPYGRLCESPSDGSVRIVPTVGREVEGGVKSDRRLPAYIISPHSPFSVERAQSEQTLVHPKTPALSSLSDLQSEPDDLRGCDESGRLDQPSLREAGAVGMPMLDAGQGETSGQPMLPEHATNGESPGLA